MKWPIGTVQWRILGVLALLMGGCAAGLEILGEVDLKGLLISDGLVLLVLFALLTGWLARPLHLLTRSLRSRDASSLTPLLGRRRTEFGQLAEMVQDFIRYQQRLQQEIQERRQAEQTLRHYSLALEQSANAIVITDRNGTIEYVNPKFLETTGYTRDEAIGATPRILKSGRTPQEQYQQLWNTITSGREWRGELRNRRKDGRLYWELASIAPIRDERGAITHFVAIKEDISQRKLMEATLHASELRYRNVFATVGDALLLLDSRNGRIFSVNPAACKLYGYTRTEFLSLTDRDLSASLNGYIELPHTVSKRLSNYLHRRKDGTIFPADIWIRHFAHKGYKVTVAAVRDMTRQKQAEQKIIRLSCFYAALSRTSAAIIRCVDQHDLFQQIGQIIAELEQIQMVLIGFVDPETGWIHPVAHASMTPGYAVHLTHFRISNDPTLFEGWGPTGKAFRQGEPEVSNDLLTDPDAQPWHEVIGTLGIRAGAAFPLRRNGQIVGCLSAYATEKDYFDDDIVGLLNSLAGELSFALDLFERETLRKDAEDRAHHLATHDALTGLPNRILLLDRLTQAIHAAHRNQSCVGVLFLDLDHFKTINDSQGHDIGDQLLQSVTLRLRGCTRQEDTLARQGGDEFILVLPNLTDPTMAGRVAEHLLQALRTPFILNNIPLHIDASIGISIYPLDSTDPSTLIRFADSAMYQAKEVGRGNYAFFTHELSIRASELFVLSNELRLALDRDEFVLYYQPQIEMTTRQPIGVEALIRWRHPERGLILPMQFIGVAEETGLIGAIGEWTLRTACAQGRRWQEAGLPPLSIAINLSAKQWLQPHLEDQVLQTLATSGLAPQLLELEITESLLMRDSEKMVAIMRRLQAHGVRFAVDDFGIGYSSLSYLKRFPVSRLKIDQSFVRGIPDDFDDAAIATAIIQMGKSLRLSVVAEGVETEAQLHFLRQQGCDIAQGFYFSRPLPAGECETTLRQLLQMS
ncbi:MAG: EAL domain-containing protein [Candidatus Competibacteraceae bacterium]|nr:MAG: EAL domain-containing protein [Candidatus Competibacteraceae bacterium]